MPELVPSNLLFPNSGPGCAPGPGRNRPECFLWQLKIYVKFDPSISAFPIIPKQKSSSLTELELMKRLLTVLQSFEAWLLHGLISVPLDGDGEDAQRKAQGDCR